MNKSGVIGKVHVVDGKATAVTIGNTVYSLQGQVVREAANLTRGDEVEFSTNERGEITYLKAIFKVPRDSPAVVEPAESQQANAISKKEMAEQEQVGGPPISEVILAQSTASFTSTINLGNYESLKASVTGPALAAEDLKKYLSYTLGTFGRKDELTAEAIDHYRRRVFTE